MREQKSLRRETDKAMNTEIIKITVNDKDGVVAISNLSSEDLTRFYNRNYAL
mgnify:CR=1 FL=1